MEYWSGGVLKKGIKPSAISPLLQHSNTPKPVYFEIAHSRDSSLSSWIRNLSMRLLFTG